MKKIACFLFVITTAFFTACSSPDTPEPPKIEDAKEEETTDPPMDEEPSGADLLFNETAVMETQNSRIPYVFYNKAGAASAAIDDNLDGVLDKIILKDGDLETVIEMNTETGLPTKMYTSEGLLVIYNFKEDNSRLDVAILQQDIPTLYLKDIDVSTFSFTSKTSQTSKSIACQPMENVLATMANGYNWGIGSWCKIREDNNIVFQQRNLTARECDDIYRTMFPCCQISVYADTYCTQLPNQTKVLAEITELAECFKNGALDDCIINGLINVQEVLNGSTILKNEIGGDIIAQAENVIFNLVDNNPGGNSDLVGKWLLERQEELIQGSLDTTVVNTEYCEESQCYTILEGSLEFNADGSWVSIFTSLEKENGPNSQATNETIEKQEGKWTYSAETEVLLIVSYSYEYKENGVVTESVMHTEEEGEIISVTSFTVSDTNAIFIFESKDNDADGIIEASYTEFYKKG